MAWPAAGPSTTMRSWSPDRSSCLILPSTTMSSMPGAAVPIMSITPVRFNRLAMRANPLSRRYSSSASGAEIDTTSRSGTSSASVGLPSSSTTSTRRPAFDAARAITAVTVVFPTPPLPATTTTRAAVNDCSGYSLSGGTFAKTSDQHPHADGRAHSLRPVRPGAERRHGPARCRVRRRFRRGRPRRRAAGQRILRPDSRRRDRRRDRPRRNRRIAGPHPAGQQRRHGRRRRRGRRPARPRRQRPDSDRHLGRPERRPLLRNRRPTAGGCRRHRHGPGLPGRLHRCPARPAGASRGDERRLRHRRGTTPQRLDRAVGRTIARRVQATRRRRGRPHDQQHAAGDGRLRGERRRGRHHQAGRPRRRIDPLRHGVGGALLEALPARPVVPHRGQPAGRLPAAVDRAGTAGLRVLHRRRRPRRRHRCDLDRARVHRSGGPAHPDPGRWR